MADGIIKSTVAKSVLTKSNLAYSPLTPVKEARALEEEVSETPRKRTNQGQKSKNAKNRKTDSKPKENFYKSLNKSK